ncbi:hypothetical protein M8T34_22490 [Enterobacter hormaechei]|uniref:hypothetical protein n=1 Tax=Enterobacter hormaechei TaxID=158836 RepID=UPI002021FE96|nr:hypothetical protein [Enterobacter hormaechei]MCL8097013.1 hypothetical protein [Enterobacter hormaechei]MCM8028799.1 hypothetical protein [Enterobacter hormaechei]MCM8048044.1 hypothetical protein [Enterobacter hormaechei]
MSIKNLVEMIKHNGLLTSMAQLEKLYRIAIENEEKLAESEARCTALAAELSSVEAIHNEAVFITDDRYEQCPPEVQKIIRSLAVMQIPAYQAFLAEVRAQGVDTFGDYLNGLGWDEADIKQVREFAAQLRKGAAL